MPKFVKDDVNQGGDHESWEEVFYCGSWLIFMKKKRREIERKKKTNETRDFESLVGYEHKQRFFPLKWGLLALPAPVQAVHVDDVH